MCHWVRAWMAKVGKTIEPTMTEYFYRYRPIKAVLDEFHELDNQEIYFSTTNELNDPIEGYKDLFWLGDKIVWRNLLKHYILCILQIAPLCIVAADQFDPAILGNIVFNVPESFRDAPIRAIHQQIAAKFLAEQAVETFVSLMAARTTPIRRNELTGYLRALHGFALKIIVDDYHARGLLRPVDTGLQPPPHDELTQNVITMMQTVPKIASPDTPPEKTFELAFAANDATFAQTNLIFEYRLLSQGGQMPTLFLVSRFPAAYVAALERLVHRNWYLACFSKVADDHSMWSTYANGHRGICLMFKAEPNAAGAPALKIEMVTSVHGSHGKPMTYSSSFVSQEFRPVRYTTQYPAIDFFRSLATISEKDMNSFWYLGEDGSFSQCRDAVYHDIDAWRRHYWQSFSESALYKTPEWEREKEYRIVVHSGFDMRAKEKRKLKYRFQDLAGIVFGARTEIEDKLKIMRIIDEKCAREKRSDFKFFEIRYLHADSRFQLFPLGLLTLNYDA
jgi:hypothetical protein